MSTKSTVIGGKLKLKGSSSSSKPIAKPSSSSTVQPPSSSASSTDVSSPKEKKSSSGDDDENENTTKQHNLEHEIKTIQNNTSLTEAQKRFKIKKLEREKEELKKLSARSYRERIDEFNYKLSKLTEHNDIPRVSAAGNG
jgi:protein FAM32A